MTSVVTNTGLAIASNLISGLGGTTPKYLAHGTGAGTALVTDTALFSETSDGRTSGTMTRITVTVTDDSVQIVGTIIALSTETITNAGLFDASTGGNLFYHTNFGSIALNEGDVITYTVTVTF
ncbi:MAG: phage tail fiber protein [Ktedonobacteraceae bacterium]